MLLISDLYYNGYLRSYLRKFYVNGRACISKNIKTVVAMNTFHYPIELVARALHTLKRDKHCKCVRLVAPHAQLTPLN